jgi:hypothetical protein
MSELPQRDRFAGKSNSLLPDFGFPNPKRSELGNSDSRKDCDFPKSQKKEGEVLDLGNSDSRDFNFPS